MMSLKQEMRRIGGSGVAVNPGGVFIRRMVDVFLDDAVDKSLEAQSKWIVWNALREDLREIFMDNIHLRLRQLLEESED